jgi:glycosyltransferase involved in cell wall biosynthesis
MMRVLEGFAREGVEVELWAPRRQNINELIHTDPFEYHLIEHNFKIQKLPVIDLMPYSAGKLGFFIMLGSFITSVFFKILFMNGRKDTVFYFFDLRDAFTTHWLSNKTFCEIHMYYRSSVDFINRRGFKLMRGIIAATKPLRTDITRDYKVPQEKILYAPCGVNFERFGIDTPKAEARKILDLPQDKKIILYVGHLFPVKGVDVLFDVHSHLKTGETIYFVGGTDEDIEGFKQKWQNAGSPKNIIIVGRKPHQDIPLWLRAADILSIPNTAKEAAGATESSPSKLMEYMASGRPIVASDVLGITDVMDGTMGYLVEPDSAEAIATAAHEIFENPNDAERRAENARKAARGLGWEERAQHISNFIETRIH